MITQERLKELLNYNPDTGIFTRLTKVVGKKIGSIAGGIDKDGYIVFSLKYDPNLKTKKFRAHRLAWFYTHGFFPKEQIDHINRVKTDNRIVNLREATRVQNMCNYKVITSNTSKLKGVYYDDRSTPLVKRWMSSIMYSGKTYLLGRFLTKEEAKKAYDSKAKELQKEFYPK